MNVQDTFQELTVQPSASELAELYQLQATLTYEPFTHKTQPDGNIVCGVDESTLPAWVKTMYPSLCAESKFYNFLKNKGGVQRHIDVARKCTVTFPLVTITQPTHFYDTFEDENPYAQLTHGTKAYLQNNSKIHDVPECAEERLFFQIAFDKSYQEMLLLV
jgi:hypothetical protein